MQNEISIYFGLIGAAIGAIAAVISQYFSSLFTTRRDCKKLKNELLAEERSLAYLLTEYHNIYIDEIILSKSFLRLAAISFDAQVENSDFYKSGYEALDRAEKFENEIRITTATYLKVITHFTNLTKKRDAIYGLFNQLNNFEKPYPSKFSEIKTTAELSDARNKEIERMRKVYRFFPNIYDRIFEEMKKSVK